MSNLKERAARVANWREDIIRLLHEGKTPREIVCLLDVPQALVVNIAAKQVLKRSIKQAQDRAVKEIVGKILANKEKQLEAVVGAALDVMLQFIKELKTEPDRRKETIKSIKDLSEFVDLSEKINEMLAKEQEPEQETVTQSITFEQTRHSLQELSKADPVFGEIAKISET